MARIAERVMNRIQRLATYRRVARRAVSVSVREPTAQESERLQQGRGLAPRGPLGPTLTELVAYVADRPIGHIIVNCRPAGADRWPGCWAFDTYVMPAWRAAGAGEALIRASLRVAEASGASEMFGLVDPVNDRSIRFHTKLGGQVVAAEWPARLSGGRHRLVLRWDIGAQSVASPSEGERS